MLWKVSSASRQSWLGRSVSEAPAIGGKPAHAQLGQVDEAPADAEVVGIVDGGLGTQRPVFLVVLLDPGVLVIDVQGRGGALREYSGLPSPRGAAGDAAAEDQLHLFGPAEIEVLADHLFEQQAAMGGPIEHLKSARTRLGGSRYRSG